jgi:hypothetical protein
MMKGAPVIVARFDLEDPPDEPPEGADPLVWRMATAIRAVHQPDATSCCVCCAGSEPWPCAPSRLAARGYRLALRLRQTPDEIWWPGYNQRTNW